MFQSAGAMNPRRLTRPVLDLLEATARDANKGPIRHPPMEVRLALAVLALLYGRECGTWCALYWQALRTENAIGRGQSLHASLNALHRCAGVRRVI